MTIKETLSHEEFTSNLDQFIGSMQFYPIAFTPLIFTEGIRYFAETCECFWLVDLIGYNLTLLHKRLGALFIDIEVNKRHTVHITVRQDSGMPIVFEKKQRDLCKVIPVGAYRFYLINNTLLLPSEY
jgi:hypothetical protein